MADGQLAIRRFRQHTSPRTDIPICTRRIKKHRTVPETNSIRLEECLSVKPKSLCLVRDKHKVVTLAKGEIREKEKILRNQLQCNNVQVNNQPTTLSSRCTVENHPAISSSKRTGETGCQKVSFRDIESLPGKMPEVKFSVTESPSKISDHGKTVARITQQTLRTKSSTKTSTEKIKILQTSQKFRNNGNMTRTTQGLNVSLFHCDSKGYKKLPNRQQYFYSPRSTQGPQLRCKTSVGHYRTEPEQKTIRTTKSAGFLRYRHDLEEADASIVELAERMEALVTENTIHKFESIFLFWDMDTRQRVINYKADSSVSSSVFFRACQLSRVSFVELMLKEGNPDLEQTGVFHVSEDNTVFQVTPLWHAAASGNFHLVRLLTAFGANVNATSSTGCSAVRAACCVSSVAIVTYLIAHGADIHSKNSSGGTCLLNAIMSPEIITILIHFGSKINDVDNKGNTVLHYAAEAGSLQTVKLLVEMGANPMTLNKENCHAILMGAINGQRKVVDHLLKVAMPSVEEMVDIYFVLGCISIIMENDYSSGYVYWNKASQLKRISNKVSRTCSYRSVLADFINVKDMTGTCDVSGSYNDSETLCIQALLIYERIRGASDENFPNLLMHTGASSADNKNVKLAINLWKTAYKLRLDKYIYKNCNIHCCDILNSTIMRNLRYLLKILCYVSQELKNGNQESNKNNKEMTVPEHVVRDLFQIVCLHIISANTAMKHIKNGDKKFTESFSFLMKIGLSIFYEYLTLFPGATLSSEVGANLQKLVRLNIRGVNNETLLHMCLDWQQFQAYDPNSNTLTSTLVPSFTLLRTLLLLGADPLARDSNGNTVLHLTVQLYKQGVALDPRNVRMMLMLGVHPDQVNHRQETPMDLLASADYLRQVLLPTALKCLAARTIVSHKISYTGEVPKCLYSFIELHT